MKYPDYVKKYRPKGTIVKKVKGIFYVYEATSKRVEGKSYPVQVIGGLVGKIDEKGYHKSTKKIVDVSQTKIFEYGFTNFLLSYEKSILFEKKTVFINKSLFRSLIVYMSPNSYLINEEIPILTIDELKEKYNFSVSRKLKTLSDFIEYDLKLLEPLKYICMVEINKTKIYPEMTKEQKEILEKLGIDYDRIKSG